MVCNGKINRRSEKGLLNVARDSLCTPVPLPSKKSGREHQDTGTRLSPPQHRRSLPDFRDLKIPGWEVLGRLQEVNLHNQACARELSTHLPAVLATSRTSFHPICRRIENVSILRLFLLEKNVPIDVIFSYIDENVY